MQDIQHVFNRIQENKKKLKDLKSAYTEALKNSQQYIEVAEEIKALQAKKKQMETVVKEQFSKEMTEMDDLKIDIASDNELITDIAVTQMMKGQTIGIRDKNDEEYEPIFSVKFKKVG